MKILLLGRPNSGKSTLFNALTGGHVRTGNWHGVTVGLSVRRARLDGTSADVVDLPGIYAPVASSMEEQVTRGAVEEGADLILLVADVSDLPSSLALYNAVRGRGRVAIAVTMADVLRRRGGYFDASALSSRLGVPVIFLSARSRADLRRLRTFLKDTAERPCGRQEEAKAESLSGIWYRGEERESLFERLLYNRFFAPAFFLGCFVLTFLLAFGGGMPGVLLKDLLASCFSSAGERLAAAVPVLPAAEFVRALFSGVGSVLSFLPQIAILNLSLLLLEESGALSALAFLTDGLFERIGLTGRAVFSLLMGFGCTAAAILTTRALENKPLQRRVILSLTYLSCSAKMPVFLAVTACFFEDPFLAVLAIYAGGVLLALVAALLLKGGTEESVFEIARVRMPCARTVAKSLLFSLKQFIIKVATVVAAFLILMWALLSFAFPFEYVGTGGEGSILAQLCGGLKYLFYPMGLGSWQVALAALSGIVAKENVAGTLALFYPDLSAVFTPASAAAFLVFLMTCAPCCSAIAASAREAGARFALLAAAAQTFLAFAFGYLTFALFTFPLVRALAAGVAALAAAALLSRFFHEKIHRADRAKTSGFHGRKLRRRFLRLFPPSPRPRHPRQRRPNGRKHPPARGRRGDLFHHPARGIQALLRRRL